MGKISIGSGKYYFFVGPKDSICSAFDPDLFVKCFSFDKFDDAVAMHTYFSLLFQHLNFSDYDYVGGDFYITSIKEV